MNKFTGIDYIKIDIANQYGLDKKSFKERIAWVNKVKDLKAKQHTAEKPAQFMAAVYALEDALAGKPSGHLVGLDACASGVAILGILSGCPDTCKNTGITGQKRMDFYSEITKAMNGLLDEDIVVPRADAKKASMTSFYGSKAKPKELFGDETEELMAFYAAQETIAPGACMMMRELLASWQPYALEHSHTMPDGFNAIVPVLQKMKSKIEIDELNHASINYIYEDNVGMEKGLSVAANLTHATDAFIVRELVRRCNYNKKYLLEKLDILQNAEGIIGTPSEYSIENTARDHGFLSLRGIDHITEHNAITFSMDYRDELRVLIEEVLCKPSFAVICIHDEMKSHAIYMNYLRETYVGILAELADSTVGQQIIREVRNDSSYTLTKITDDLGTKILKGEYFLS